MRNKNLKTALSKMNELEQMKEVSVLTTLSANAIRGGVAKPVKCEGTFSCDSFSCSSFSCTGTFSTAPTAA